MVDNHKDMVLNFIIILILKNKLFLLKNYLIIYKMLNQKLNNILIKINNLIRNIKKIIKNMILLLKMEIVFNYNNKIVLKLKQWMIFNNILRIKKIINFHLFKKLMKKIDMIMKQVMMNNQILLHQMKK